jgi:cell division septum initiation protein DivIVA
MRTEYINTLEGDVAERDRLIDAIRAELGSTKSENAALQQEIKALKKALLGAAGRSSSPVLPPPSPLPISVPAPTLRPIASSSSLLTPNMHKDLPSTSLCLAAKAFWGGNSTAFGGITPVHTVTFPAYSRAQRSSPPCRRTSTRHSTRIMASTASALRLSVVRESLRRSTCSRTRIRSP